MPALIERLRIQNFKGFSDSGSLDFSGINLFLGANSAGKSSILHLLVALKQTLKDSNPENRLITDGRIIELGAFSDVIHRHDSKSSLKVELSMAPDSFSEFGVSSDPDLLHHIPNRYSLTFNSTQRVRRTYLKTFEFYRRDRLLVSGASSSVGELAKWGLGEQRKHKRNVLLRFEHFLPEIWFTGVSIPRSGEIFTVARALAIFSRAQHSFFDSLVYLGPIRTPIKPVHRVTGESPVDVGPTGENLLGVLYRDEKRKRLGRRNLLKNLDAWLDKRFDLVKNIKLEPLSKSGAFYSLMGLDSKSGIPVNLSSVGFGVSQIAPVIVQGFLSRPNSAMVIEQPEIHLHPSAQADLGDLFIQFLEDKKQMFIETHSQHLLYRLLRRIAEGVLPPSELRVYVVSRTSKGSHIEKLNLDDRGRITNWPMGFFEEGYEETAATARALVANE